MIKVEIKNMDRKIINTSEVISAYFKQQPSYCEPYGNGHINDTFLVVSDKRYILQRMNTYVFPNPIGLMDNIVAVTEHIRKKAKSMEKDTERATLVIVPTLNGENYFVDSNNNYWRVYDYVEGTVAYEKMKNKEQFESCGEAFGEFQQMLSDFPADSLNESVKNLHNTPWRYDNLMAAVKKDAFGRAAFVKKELEFAKAREQLCHILANNYQSGKLPLRVTHNDTKLNNILFDEKTDKPVCVIDLDTVMPGFSVVDFGDSIRSGGNTASDDETDLSKVNLDMGLFEAYVKGFLTGCNNSLTENEIDLLAISALIITFECGMRFLTDYLEGDVYFKIHREGHNLDRARCQFALAYDMECKLDEMKSIVNMVAKDLKNKLIDF